jgi:hypothetical protein
MNLLSSTEATEHVGYQELCSRGALFILFVVAQNFVGKSLAERRDYASPWITYYWPIAGALVHAYTLDNFALSVLWNIALMIPLNLVSINCWHFGSWRSSHRKMMFTFPLI